LSQTSTFRTAYQAARKALDLCWFDEQACGKVLEALRQYQREWDEDKKCFREKPRRDWTSPSGRMLSDAGCGVETGRTEAMSRIPASVRLIVGQVPESFAQASLNDMWKAHERGAGRKERL